MTLRVGSLFSGIGGFDLGFERAGMRIEWVCEIDKAARAVLRRRFPNAIVLEDIREVDPSALPPVDVVCGGFPCQDLSVAGKRAGLAGERSGLFHEAMRIVRGVRPSVLVLENVPGLLSSNRGLDFATVLREVGEGWDCEEVAWRVLDSQFFGVPQRRRRVFVVAVGGSRTGCAEQILSLRSSGLGNPPSRGEARQAAPSDAARGSDGGRKWPADIAATLNAAFGEKQGLEDQHALSGASHFVPHMVGKWWDGSDCAASMTTRCHDQSMPDKGNFAAVVQAYSPHGHYRYEASEQSATLQDRENRQSGSTHLVAQAFRKSKRAQTETDDETWVDDGIANTLNGFDTGDARTTHIVCQHCGHRHDEDRICTECGNDLRCDTLDLCSDCLEEEAGKRGQTISVEPLETTHAVAFTCSEQSNGFAWERPIFPTITAQVPSDTSNLQTGIRAGMVVRRLTPVECERLQGFPDGWTDIGTPEKPTADSHRYKQLGNAVTVNVAEWIGRRIVRAIGDEP